MLETFSSKILVLAVLTAVSSDALFLPSCLMRPFLGGLGGFSTVFPDRWIREAGGIHRVRRFLWTNEDACDWLCDSRESERDLKSLCARCCGWSTTAKPTTTTTAAPTTTTTPPTTSTPSAAPSTPAAAPTTPKAAEAAPAAEEAATEAAAEEAPAE